MSQPIAVDVEITDEEITNLRAMGIEVRRSRGGVMLRPNDPKWQPKTVTGYIDSQTNEFVGFVFEPPKSDDLPAHHQLMVWRMKEE